jgi:phosphatidylserine/phosphatidylglycerophosphate/cardiolipin synthase-like enzyme
VLTAGMAVVKAVQSARQFIYMEDQYFTGSQELATVFRAAIRDKKLIIIVNIASDDAVNDVPDLPFRRWEFLHPLVTSFPDNFLVFERLGSGSPTGPTAYVHSKVLIADDEALLIGTVNSNRRCWFHDTEVQATIVDAKGPGGTAAGSRGWVRDFRCTLWSWHLPPNTSLGNPTADLAVWRGIGRGTVIGASVRHYNVPAVAPPRPSYAGVQVPVGLLQKYWDTFADPK